MSTGRVLLSLTTVESDYQRAQAAAADAVAKQLGAGLEISYADNDPVLQSQQILSAIQRKNHGIEAVLTEPVGTGMFQVAQAAAKDRIAWGVLNRDVDYVSSLRAATGTPVFEVGVDQAEVGAIHAAQVSTLVPGGGTILYIEGPSGGTAAKQRTQGVMAKKPANVDLKIIKGNWTEESAHRAVASWLKLRTSQSHGFVAVVAQNDLMAIGARKAFSEHSDPAERSNWLQIPFLGCDGIPETGQQFVRRGQLAATIIYPLVASVALETYWRAKSSGSAVPERTMARPVSFPVLEALRPKAANA